MMILGAPISLPHRELPSEQTQ